MIIIIIMNDPVQFEINKTNIKEGLRTDPLDERNQVTVSKKKKKNH